MTIKGIRRRLRKGAVGISQTLRTATQAHRVFTVEASVPGRLWLFDDERYAFRAANGAWSTGAWHELDGSLLVFDHYVHTNDGGRTYYSYKAKLTLENPGGVAARPNCNPFFYDPARHAYDAPRLAERDRALFTVLPHNAVVAELGVETGAFARTIVEQSSPAKLHLIDCWESIPDPWPSYEAQKKNYDDVATMFAEQITAGTVEIHKGDDLEIIETFPDAYFDWVYIDTTHQYEQTLRELLACSRKVKPNGFICGHDYADTRLSRRYGWGVIRAVDELIRRTDWDYAYLTEEPSATFVLQRREK
jgi:hypothetical protein